MSSNYFLTSLEITRTPRHVSEWLKGPPLTGVQRGAPSQAPPLLQSSLSLKRPARKEIDGRIGIPQFPGQSLPRDFQVHVSIDNQSKKSWLMIFLPNSKWRLLGEYVNSTELCFPVKPPTGVFSRPRITTHSYTHH